MLILRPGMRRTDRVWLLLPRLQTPLSDLCLGLGNLLLRAPGHRFRVLVLRRVLRITVGANVTVQRGLKTTTRRGVAIGAQTIINRDALLDGRGELHIGDNVNISPEVMIWTAEHDPDSSTFAGRTAPVVIGSRAWIATRAVILPGVTIGDGAVVAAGSVVASDVLAWTIVGGSPAVVIRERSRDAQERLTKYHRWWH